jgi:hypothetical protein
MTIDWNNRTYRIKQEKENPETLFRFPYNIHQSKNALNAAFFFRLVLFPIVFDDVLKVQVEFIAILE